MSSLTLFRFHMVKNSFQETQYQFAGHIRSPDKVSAPSKIEERRMAIYRELFYNNINNFIESGFPVLNSILSHDEWHQLVREFMQLHKAKSPYFAEVSKEFLAFLDIHNSDLFSKYPFIKELAHYEWVELALMINTADLGSIKIKDSVDLMNEIPVLSPLAWPLVYEFDVQRISNQYTPEKPPEQATFIVVYRNRQDDVEFTEINAVTFSLLHFIEQNPNMTGEELLKSLAAQMPQIPEEAIMKNGLDILMKLMKRDIILGAREL